MDQAVNSGNGARRNEDIALDLFKFIATTASVGRSATGATGFVPASASKPEDQIDHLLKLYSRCLKTVSGQEPSL